MGDAKSQDTDEIAPMVQGGEANSTQSAETLDSYVRIMSTVTLTLALITMYFAFLNPKPFTFFWFHKVDSLWPTLALLILYCFLVVSVYLRPPIRLRFVPGVTLQIFIQVLTVFLAGLVAFELTKRSRYGDQVATGRRYYYLVKCRNLLNMDENFTHSDCFERIEISPNTVIKPPSSSSSSLADLWIVIYQLTLYLASLAILLRPALNFALTLFPLHLSFLFLFDLYEDSGSMFPCFYMSTFLMCSLVLVGINNWVTHKVDTQERHIRMGNQLQSKCSPLRRRVKDAACRYGKIICLFVTQ